MSGVALVIGGSGGIGAAICRHMAADWDHVLVGYHSNREKAENVGAGVAVRVDLRDGDLLAAVLADHAPRAIVVASGFDIAQPYVADTAASAWRDVIETELIGFTNLVARLIPIFRAQGGGSIVAVTSFANVHFPPGDALSSVPKAGIEALCRAVAKEEGRYGIRANCVAPAMVNAGLGARYQQGMFDPAIWDRVRRRIPLGRFAEASDIAQAVAFLASDRAAFITGQTLVVDGGQSL